MDELRSGFFSEDNFVLKQKEIKNVVLTAYSDTFVSIKQYAR